MTTHERNHDEIRAYFRGRCLGLSCPFKGSCSRYHESEGDYITPDVTYEDSGDDEVIVACADREVLTAYENPTKSKEK